jgi:hypothetical protein
MHAITRRQLESGENLDALAQGGGAKGGNARHVIVVGDREHRDTEAHRHFDDLARMGRLVLRERLAAKFLGVAVRIHLQRAAMEHRAGQKRGGRVRGASGHDLAPIGSASDRRMVDSSGFPNDTAWSGFGLPPSRDRSGISATHWRGLVAGCPWRIDPSRALI